MTMYRRVRVCASAIDATPVIPIANKSVVTTHRPMSTSPVRPARARVRETIRPHPDEPGAYIAVSCEVSGTDNRGDRGHGGYAAGGGSGADGGNGQHGETEKRRNGTNGEDPQLSITDGEKSVLTSCVADKPRGRGVAAPDRARAHVGE